MASNEPDSTIAPAPRAGGRLSGHGKHWLLAITLLLLAVWGAQWGYYRWTHVQLDDARIAGEVVTISSRVSGWITELPVIEGDFVKQGELLARIDSRDIELGREALVARLRALEHQSAMVLAQAAQADQETLGKYESEVSRLAAAEAQVAVLGIQVKQAEDDYRRARDLAEAKWLPAQALERARRTHEQALEAHRRALAEVAAARGMLAAAGGSRRQLEVMAQQRVVLRHQADEIRTEIRRRDVDIADRTITAPSDGRVVMTFARRGEHVSPGQRILMFHDPQNIWVEANVRETEVRKLAPGMRAEVRVDAYPGRVFEGEVFRIGQTATSQFALLPDPNPSGNFTKITQRLPVRIHLADRDASLRPGMMVVVSIAVRND
jgi:membrane fusion protein, multidrug efflux system